jgi:glycosyltransferase involved in cell wall biosynthesis
VRVLVVVPTYQEAENVGELLIRLRAAVPEADVLVVDDDSPDGTAEITEAAGRALGRVRVLVRERKGGLGSAYRAGFGRGLEEGYDVIVQMDADLSHDPAAVPSLLAAVTAGADIAVGSRYVAGGSIPNWPAYRRNLSRFGNRYATRMLGLGINDATSGFRAYRADALRGIDVVNTTTTGYGFQIELANRVARAGYLMTEVPIVFRDRVRGTSKMSLGIVGEALWSVTRWGIGQRLGRGTASGFSAHLSPHAPNEGEGHREQEGG